MQNAREQQLNEQHYREAAYYAAVFTIGFLASLFRIVRDGDYINGRRALAFALTSGSVSFGVIAILRDYLSDGVFGHLAGLGLSALLGLASKYQDSIAKSVVGFVLAKVGIKIDTQEQEKSSS